MQRFKGMAVLVESPLDLPVAILLGFQRGSLTVQSADFISGHCFIGDRWGMIRWLVFEFQGLTQGILRHGRDMD